MNSKQIAAFQHYLGLGPIRSLARAVEGCRSRGIFVSLSTLKRWSIRFGWADLLAKHDGLVGEVLLARSVGMQADQLTRDLHAVSVLKGRFLDRARVDPADPNLSAAERRRVVNVSLNDYLKLLTIEHDLLARVHPIAAEPAAENKVGGVDKGVLSARIADHAKRRYGLPD